MNHFIIAGPGDNHLSRGIAVHLAIMKDPMFHHHVIIVETPKNGEYEEKFRKWNFQRMSGFPSKDLQTKIMDIGIKSFYQLQEEYNLIEKKQSQLSRINRDRVRKAYQIITKDEPHRT